MYKKYAYICGEKFKRGSSLVYYIFKKSIELYFFAIKKSGDLRYQSKNKFNVRVLSVDLTWFLDCEVMPDFQDSGEQLSFTLFLYLKTKKNGMQKKDFILRYAHNTLYKLLMSIIGFMLPKSSFKMEAIGLLSLPPKLWECFH